ncbi:MAG TPA: hypothetical protein VKB84_21850 [Candidatus Binataceae bacterium]|nr:hypothetical protein [Candidatus Binataceae bacterium]
MFGISIGASLAFPYRRLSLETSLPAALVLMRIQDAVEPRRLMRISKTHRDFEGAVSRTQFRIRRIIHHRNSFLPIVAGTIQPSLRGGTRVEVVMRMSWLVTAFMFVWAGVPLIAVSAAALHLHFGSGVAAAAAHQTAGALIGGAVATITFGYCLCSASFNLEAQRAKELLTRIVAASTA